MINNENYFHCRVTHDYSKLRIKGNYEREEKNNVIILGKKLNLLNMKKDDIFVKGHTQ